MTIALISLARSDGGALASEVGSRPTYVGSGEAGFSDGTSLRASFVEPIGLTPYAGELYVADAGSQRIRKISATGQVSTIAGSGGFGDLGLGVTGGFRDGPALQARFDHPSAILAERDGSLIVADTRNHCLRRVANGVVSTIAGSPNRSAGNDGPALQASLHDPRGLAQASDGTIYIADHSIGLRVLDRNGNLSTRAIPVIGPDIVAISLTQAGGQNLLFATNETETIQIDLKTSEWRLWSANREERGPYGVSVELEGGRGTGNPLGIVAMAPDEFAYADAEHDTVAYVHDKYTAQISQSGTLTQPGGVAILPDGRVAVADTGGRRIAFFSAPDRRFWYHPSPLPNAKDPGVYRIALIGNSYIYYDTPWTDSIPGIVQDQIMRDAHTNDLRQRIEMYPIRFGSFSSMAQYSNEVLSSGLFDAVILQLNSHFLVSTYDMEPWSPSANSEPLWKAKFASDLQSFVKPLKDANVPLIVVTFPESAEIGPLEAVPAFEADKGNGLTVDDFGPSLRELPDLVKAAGVACSADLSQEFVAAEKAVPRVPLYGPKDWHLTSAGRHVLSAGILSLLERCRPWTSGANATTNAK